MSATATADPISAAVYTTLRRLDWDTEFFDSLMGVVEVDRSAQCLSLMELTAELESQRDNARRQAYRHLILRARSEDFSTIWAAEAAGFRLVDVGVDLRCQLPESRGGQCQLLRPWLPEDLPQLREIAASSFIYSRFAADPFFSAEEVSAFHETWISNLCHGLAQEVLVVGEISRPLGFVACSISGDTGRIPLIAVKRDGRGKGLGQELVSGALAWFAAHGCREAWVKTQAHNCPALALYQRHGFAITNVELALSLTLGTSSRDQHNQGGSNA
ncbi:hypothetical protein AYO38_06210 [bacterium SCGC AG-212-C10]|nr:hypothetical protein AYO38_06210 [bacterium SCGC AG-212-C10]